MKNKLTLVLFAMVVFFPFMAQADIVGLQSTPAPAVVTPPILSPLSCFDLNSSFKMGNKGYTVRGLQFALIKEGATISASEYGTFGPDTLAAVKAFQSAKGLTPDGLVGKMTYMKLNGLHGCGVVNPVVSDITYGTGCTSSTGFSPTTGLSCSKTPDKISLSVQSVTLDSNGATAVFCNNGPMDLASFPVRLRLNGIIRDFDVLGARKAHTCDTDTLPYSTWGLSYDSTVTFGLVSGIDPNNIYKTSTLNYPGTGTTTLSIPAVAGAHLSIRGLFLKGTGVQATLCNLGDTDLQTFPVRVTVNGVAKDLDINGAHTHGQCPVVLWTYDMFGLPATPAVGTLINATVNVDPNNTYKETNEFDNSATILGNL